MVIYYTPNFAKAYKKLPRTIKESAEKKEALFRNNPFDPKLKTHQLTGKLDGLWAFRINYKYRIVCEFVNKNEVWFHAVGTHAVYN